MGRDKHALDKLSGLERRLCDNVLGRLPEPSQKSADVAALEDEFGRISYELLKREASDFPSYPSIHPSEVGGCPLRVAFGLRGFKRIPPSDPDPRMILRFEIGHAIHRIFQSRYRKFSSRVMFEEEVDISPDTSKVAERYSITGHCDGVFTEIATSRKMGLEIKSASGRSFAGAVRLSDHYKKQATMYMACLGLDHMMFLFVNKDSARIQPVLYAFDEELWKQLEQKMDDILLKVVSGLPVDKHTNSVVCRTMCAFSWACKPEV